MFCYNFYVVQSWRQQGKRVARMGVFGLLSLQVLVPRQFVRVCHSVNMEWGVKKYHVAVIAIYNCGKTYSQIF
jgi:hypothetical protein